MNKITEGQIVQLRAWWAKHLPCVKCKVGKIYNEIVEGKGRAFIALPLEGNPHSRFVWECDVISVEQ